MSKKKILVIEDEKTCVELVNIMIDRKHFDVIVSENGEDGIKMASKEMPDLIFLDIMLPKMDGYEVARKLKSNVSTASIPIVVLSARAGQYGRQNAIDAGCQDFISKPFKMRQVRESVKRYVH